MQFQQPLPQKIGHEDALREWFTTPLGEETLHVEKALLGRVLPELFGYNLLQLSAGGCLVLTDASPIPDKLIISDKIELGMPKHAMVARHDELPVVSGSMDVVLLHHALDFAEHPHNVLREATRVLRPNGYLVVVSFNPASLWGVYKRFTKAEQVPWCGHFIGSGRLHDWFTLMQLTQVQTLTDCYTPPFEKESWRRRMAWLRHFARKSPARSGAILVHVARKDVNAMTPLKWSARRRLISLPVMEPKPTARGSSSARQY